MPHDEVVGSEKQDNALDELAHVLSGTPPSTPQQQRRRAEIFGQTGSAPYAERLEQPQSSVGSETYQWKEVSVHVDSTPDAPAQRAYEMPGQPYASWRAAKGLPPTPAKGYKADRDGILREAERLICTDRNKSYGSARLSFERVAAIWSIRLGVTVTATQFTLMMNDLKADRAWNNPEHGDSWVDICGYAALGGEIALDGKG